MKPKQIEMLVRKIRLEHGDAYHDKGRVVRFLKSNDGVFVEIKDSSRQLHHIPVLDGDEYKFHIKVTTEIPITQYNPI